MKRLSVNKSLLLFGSVFAILIASFLFTLHIHNKQQAEEQRMFDEVWAGMVADTVQVYTTCDCFNCTDHVSGYVPPITIMQLATAYEKIDWPEEGFDIADTIALNVYMDTLHVSHYNDRWREHYSECDVYIVSAIPE